MGLHRMRVDSVKELSTKKTNKELTKENEELKQQVSSLSDELTNTQVALCEVYELMSGGAE